MEERIIHNTCVPLEGQSTAFEYQLPLNELPREVDEEWHAYLAPYVGCRPGAVHELVSQRFSRVSSRLANLAGLVREYTPFAVLVFDGTPLFWLESSVGQQRDCVYLPPALEHQAVREVLTPNQLESNDILVEFLASFGGMGEQLPWEEIEFGGRRKRGRLFLNPARLAIDAGLEYASASEAEERRRLFAPWNLGIEFANGGDGQYWHVGRDGSVCEHKCGDVPRGYFETVYRMIDSFCQAATDTQLFNGLYHGLLGGGATG